MDQATISWLGDARVSAGQAFTVQRLFRDTYGNAVDLTGRSYTLSFFAAGMDAVVIGAAVDGTIASFPVASAITTGLYAAQRAGKQIQWQIVEQIGGQDGDFVFGPRAFKLSPAGAIGAAPPRPGITGAPVLQIVSGDGPATITIDSMGTPGIPQWQALGFASAAAMAAQQHADAVAAVLSSTGPIDPTHGISVGGETTIPAPAPVPADKPAWVAVYINGIRQRPGAFTSDGTATLTLAGPLDPGFEWIVEQLQRNPA